MGFASVSVTVTLKVFNFVPTCPYAKVALPFFIIHVLTMTEWQRQKAVKLQAFQISLKQRNLLQPLSKSEKQGD